MRNGKIAKLPGEIREELNRRLENGEDGGQVLEWLNGLAEVQERLKADFDGAPVSKQNLSEWRQGGFREWQIRRELIGHASDLSAGCRDLEEEVETPLLAGDLLTVLAARYAGLLNRWDGVAEAKFEENLRVLHGLARDVALMQRAMYQASRQRNEHEQKLESNEQKLKEELKQAALAPIWAAYQSEPLAQLFGGGKAGKKLADYVCAIKHGLPPPKTEVLAEKKPAGQPAGQTQSNPVKPSEEV
jgi:hypothetical protein